MLYCYIVQSIKVIISDSLLMYGNKVLLLSNYTT